MAFRRDWRGCDGGRLQFGGEQRIGGSSRWPAGSSRWSRTGASGCWRDDCANSRIHLVFSLLKFPTISFLSSEYGVANMGERVVIVGAGVAGLAAACELAGAGLQPLVLEGRARVGGRIHTLSTGDGAPIELGAEFLHGLAPEVERFICEHHLAKRQVSDDHWKVRHGVFRGVAELLG